MTTLAVTDVTQSEHSTVSWGAVIAGGIAAAALSLFLLALGVGLGLSSISPWSGQGVSATTFRVGAGVYLVCVAMLSSSGRRLSRAGCAATWAGVHNDEIYFRDTAHGLVAWAFATVLSATVLGAAATHILRRGVRRCAGDSLSAGSAAYRGHPTDIYVDSCSAPIRQPPLLRRDSRPSSASTRRRYRRGRRDGVPALRWPPVCAGAAQGRRSSPPRIGPMLARVVSARTGLNPAEAEKRVNDIIVQAKKAADDARKATAKPDAVARGIDAGRRGCVDPRRHRRRRAARLQMVRAGLARHARPQSLTLTLERSETCPFFCGSWECRSV